jgi:hypothetical protein
MFTFPFYTLFILLLYFTLYLFYSSRGLPKLSDIECTLRELRQLCDDLGVKKLAMPRIASSLDHIPWKWTQRLIRQIFQDSDIVIDVYSLPYIEPKKRVSKTTTSRDSFSNKNVPMAHTPLQPEESTAPATSQPRRLYSDVVSPKHTGDKVYDQGEDGKGGPSQPSARSSPTSNKVVTLVEIITWMCYII